MLLENLFPTGRYGLNEATFSVRSGNYDTTVATRSAGVWTLTAAGAAIVASNVATDVATVANAVGVAVGATVSALEYGKGGIVNKTVLTLASTLQAIVDATEYQGTKIYTFPEGRILVLGVTASIAQTTTSALATTLNASSTGALALGTATASSTTLNSTMADLLPSTAFTSSATVNVAGTAVGAALAAAAQFDGTTTAKDVYLNTAFATTTDVDGNATQTLSGTITMTWISLGDY